MRSLRLLAIPWIVAALAGVGCGSQTFSAKGEGGSGGSLAGSSGKGAGAAGAAPQGGSGGTAGTAGSGGNSATGGRPGLGGAGGSSGSPPPAGEGGEPGVAGEGGAGGAHGCDDDTPCPAGRYCAEDGLCRSCTDITTLGDLGSVKFKTPEPLSVVNDAAGDFLLRMPRAFGSEGALLYVRDFFGGELWLTGNPERDIGAPLPTPVNEAASIEGSPAWFPDATGALSPFNLVFGRAASAGAPAELYAASLAGNGTGTNVTRLPAPFNPETPLSESTYSMAVSRDRAWWMVNRDLMLALQFLTAPLEQSGPPSIVPLRQTEACGISEFDVTAWVTPDGRLLFVTSLERDADCGAREGEPHDVLMFRLDEAGQSLGLGVPVAGVSRPGTNELDGSLSPDMCSLYFVATQGDKLRLMRARRDR